MEIIHLILGKANPERMNGVNRVVHEMATNQVNNQYPVQVWGITPVPEHNYPERNFTTVLFQAYKNPFKVDPKLKKAFLDHKGRIVVHIHGAFLPVFYSVAKFLSKHAIPYIITPHSSYNKVMMQKNSFTKKIYFNYFEKSLLNKCTKVHLLGKSEWEGLHEIYHNEKSVIMPYGFTRVVQQTDVEKYPLFTIVYCGRISVYSKGLDILVQGFARFHQLHPDSQLVIIGDGYEMPDIIKLAISLNIDQSIIFKGALFGEQKIKELKRCHVFAHTSRTDGLPATIVEAASLGLPCVVSDATNTGGFISQYKAGFEMLGMQPDDLVEGLLHVYDKTISSNSGEALTKNAFRMIDEVFNWDTILTEFNVVYKDAFIRSQSALAVHLRM